MDQELSERLDRIEKMLSDNNRMLAKMRRSQKNAAYRTLLYWIVIIGLTIASFYAVIPYIKSLGASYGIGTGSGADSTSTSITNLINQYEAGKK